jgi:AraC family transcriptional regulator, positive regulator of tynA and feaB
VKTLFSTKGAHPRDRFDLWHSVACKQIVEHSSRPKSRPEFDAEIASGTLGPLRLILAKNAPMDVVRTSAHIGHARTDDLFICRQMAGLAAFEQSGRDICLSTGEITVLDPLQPYQIIFPSASKMLILKVPRRELQDRVGRLGEVPLPLIIPTGSEDSLVSHMIGTLPTLTLGRMNEPNKELIAHHALDLFAASLTKALKSERPRLTTARAVVLMKVRAIIDARLSQPYLSASAVAEAVGVTVRYANKVLAEHNTSIMRLVQTKRLERCRQALEDQAQAHRTVSEIAYSWGFSDMTHFGRRFREAYGMLPSEFRIRAKSSTVPPNQ